MNITVFVPTLIKLDGISYWVTNGTISFPDISGTEITPLGGTLHTLNGGAGDVLVSSGGVVQDFTQEADWIPVTFISGFAFALVVVGIPYVVIKVVTRILRQGGFSVPSE